MVASTTACLAAARFGLAPSVKKGTTAGNGLKLQDRNLGAVGLMSNDPAGEPLLRNIVAGARSHTPGSGSDMHARASSCWCCARSACSHSHVVPFTKSRRKT